VNDKDAHEEFDRVLYAGIGIRAVLVGPVLLVVLALPGSTDVHVGAVGVSLGLFATVAAALLVTSRWPGAARHNPRVDIGINALANGSAVAAMLAVEGLAVPVASTLITIQLYQHAQGPDIGRRIWAWSVGWIGFAAARLLAGTSVAMAVTETWIFAGVSGSIALIVAFLAANLRRSTQHARHVAHLAAAAASATTVPEGVARGDHAIGALTGATRVELIETLGSEPEQSPGTCLLAVGATPRGRAWLRLHGASDDTAFEPIVHLLSQLCDRERYVAELRSVSMTDPLTGVPNRRVLDEVLTGPHPVACGALVMLDLDHFKPYNDKHGHLAGDEVLVQFAALLNTELRLPDVAVRFGGEEFCLLVHGSPTDAERLVSRLRQRWSDAGGPVTFSAGIAAVTDQLPMSAATLKAADRALYRAKGAGRNRTVVDLEDTSEPAARV
jgi:diguanylate cyclase (GGDEF)-like protein